MEHYMANKIKALLFFSLFLESQYLFAQIEDSNQPHIMQHIPWETVQGAEYYEVTLQELKNGDWLNVNKTKTFNTYFDFSLSPGNYRFSIHAVDSKNKKGNESAWHNFTVLSALKPEIFLIEPDPYIISGQQISFTITGKNLLAESDVYLTLASHIEDGQKIIPSSYIADESTESAAILFDDNTLQEGFYNIYIQNPGGLKTVYFNFCLSNNKTEKPVTAPQKNKSGMGSTISWLPLIALNSGVVQESLGTTFFPAAIDIGVFILPFKIKNIRLGFQIDAAWHYLWADWDDAAVSEHLINIGGNFVVQFPLFQDKLFFLARAGGGITIQHDLHKSYYESGLRLVEDTRQQYFPSASTAVSIRWNFNNAFFLESGVGIICLFTPNSNPSLFIQPHLSAGFQW
jgi:hypothetical protein